HEGRGREDRARTEERVNGLLRYGALRPAVGGRMDPRALPRAADVPGDVSRPRLDVGTVDRGADRGGPRCARPPLRPADQVAAQDADDTAGAAASAEEVQGQEGPVLAPGDGRGAAGAVQEARDESVRLVSAPAHPD